MSLLSEHRNSSIHSNSIRNSLVKLIFPSAKRVYIARNFPGVKNTRLDYK